MKDSDSVPVANISRPAMKSTLRPIQWIPGVISPVVKLPQRESGYLFLPSTKAKNAKSFTSITFISFISLSSDTRTS
jgi:hypothetical protein